MDLKEVEILDTAVGQHWYYRSKLAALLRLLGPAPRESLVDVGAGSGFFARALLEAGVVSAATCVDPFYTEDREEWVGGQPLRFRRAADGRGADLMLLMDVLEHVEDDQALLAEYVHAAPAGAEFILSVPAFRWMWSGHDVFLGHHRRYTLPEIETLAVRCGLVPVHAAYYFGFVLPLAMATRLPDMLSRMAGRRIEARNGLKRSGPLVNTVLGAISAAELPFLRWNRVAGLTCFVVARKPPRGRPAAWG